MWQTHPLDDKTYNFVNQSLQPMWQASAPTVPLTPHLLTSVKIKLQPPAIMQQTSGRRLWQSLPPIVAIANQNCEWILDSLPNSGYEMPHVQTSTWVIWKNYVVTSENKSNKKTTTRTTRQQEQEQQEQLPPIPRKILYQEWLHESEKLSLSCSIEKLFWCLHLLPCESKRIKRKWQHTSAPPWYCRFQKASRAQGTSRTPLAFGCKLAL